MTPSRRTLITGVAAFVAAPALVRASSLMAVKPWKDKVRYRATERYLNGPYGTISVCAMDKHGNDAGFAVPAPEAQAFSVGANELVIAGDYVIIEGGYARGLCTADLVDRQDTTGLYMAMTDSRIETWRMPLPASKPT